MRQEPRPLVPSQPPVGAVRPGWSARCHTQALRAQCDTFYAELTTATSFALGVEGRLTDSIAKMLAGDVTIPDDLSGLDESGAI